MKPRYRLAAIQLVTQTEQYFFPLKETEVAAEVTGEDTSVEPETVIEPEN